MFNYKKLKELDYLYLNLNIFIVFSMNGWFLGFDCELNMVN